MKRFKCYMTWLLMVAVLFNPFIAKAAQHDFEITTADANTGVTFRAAVNASLQALASLSSGATAPLTTYAFQLWADTGNDQLKIRNAANSGWIVVGRLSEIYLGLASLSAQNDFTATQKIKGDALLLRIKDTGASGEEWGIRSDGGSFEVLKNTGTEGSPAWTVQARIDVNALRVGDGTASDIRIIANNNAGTKPEIRYQNSSSKWQYSNDGSLFNDIGSGGAAVKVPVRQTVLSSAIDSNGYANFISAGTGLAADITATSVPIRIAFAAGYDGYGGVDYVGSIESDTSISSLTASSTNYLYAERNSGTGVITLGKTLSAPHYGNSYPTYTDGNNSTGGANQYIGYDANNYYIAQKFVPVKTGALTAVHFWLKKTGSPTGQLVVEVQSDSSGSPSNTALATSAAVNESSLSTAFTEITFTFSSPAVLAAGGTYHLVIKFQNRSESTSNNSSARLNGGGYSSGLLEWCTSSLVWSSTGTYDIDFVTYQIPEYFFSIPKKIMYQLVSGSYTAKQVVFLGEAITDGSSVTSVVNYALQAEYRKRQAMFAASTFTTFNHNIGVIPDIEQIKIICTAEDLGYAVGDTAMNVIAVDSSGNRGGFNARKSRNAAIYDYPLSINASHMSTHAWGSITYTKWDVEVILKRGW